MLQRWVNLDGLSDEIGWELVAPLFRQRSALVFGSSMYIIFGLAGFAATGSDFYLVGVWFAVLLYIWRARQARDFAEHRESGSPTSWAVQALKGGWTAGLAWAAWSISAAFDTEPGLVAILLGTQAGFATGAAVLNSSVPAIARGQILLGSIPLCIACLFAPDPYLNVYAIAIVVQIGAGFTMIRTLHQGKLRTLSNEVQAVELSTKLAAAVEELEVVNQHLKQQVATDPLTGLLNRRAFDLAASREWRAAVRDERPISIIMVDVDHFKAYNDHYGHQAGDVCLRQVADVLSTLLHRPGDTLARYGGEEFIALLPSTPLEGALTVADRVLKALETAGLAHERSSFGRVSVSMGAATAAVLTGTTLNKLIERADQALYSAKRSGRARVCAAPEPAIEPVASPAGCDDLDELFLFTQPAHAASG